MHKVFKYKFGELLTIRNLRILFFKEYHQFRHLNRTHVDDPQLFPLDILQVAKLQKPNPLMPFYQSTCRKSNTDI